MKTNEAAVDVFSALKIGSRVHWNGRTVGTGTITGLAKLKEDGTVGHQSNDIGAILAMMSAKGRKEPLPFACIDFDEGGSTQLHGDDIGSGRLTIL